MDITYYFKPKNKEKDEADKKESIRIKKNNRLKNDYLKLLAKFLNSNVIDMLEYSHMINFSKSGGSIVNLGRFNQISDKILKSSTIF